MTRTLLTAALFSLPLAFACGEDDDTGNKGDEAWMPYCESVSTDLAMDEVSPLGFSGADLGAALAAKYTAPLTWGSGGSSDLLITLGLDGPVQFVDLSEAVPPEGTEHIADIAVVCDDYLRIGGAATLSSADGLLAESLSVEFSASTASSASFSLERSPTDFAHPEIFAPYEAPPGEAGDIDEVHVLVNGQFGVGGVSTGGIDYVSSGSDGNTAWQSMDQVASWGTDE